MNRSKLTAFLAAPLILAASATVVAQQQQQQQQTGAAPVVAPGYATINLAGLGNATTIAGESRIPILSRNLSYDTASSQLHVRATGTRGAVRQLDIDVHAPRPNTRYELGSDTQANLRIRLEQGADIAAESGHGFVNITSFDEHGVVGTYEGTFAHGATPVVVRGRFEAHFPRARAGSASGGGSAGGSSSTAP